MKNFKLIRSGALSAQENMAIDQEIFDQYLKDGRGVLRIYQWKEPAFTFGFSQDPSQEIDLARCAAEGVGVAKRMTGGGILFHQDEITYSFVCAKSDIGEAENLFVAYRNICAFLIEFYKGLGLNPSFAQEQADFKNRCLSHELCSAACEKYDLVIRGKKIGGNAQRRNRQAIFQHGVIPCQINWDFVRRYLRHLPLDISAQVTTLAQELEMLPQKIWLEEKLIAAFQQTFKVNFYETCLAE